HLLRRLPGPAVSARFATDGTLVTLSRTGTLTFTGDGSRRAPREIQLAPPDAPSSPYADFAVLSDGGLVVLQTDGRAGIVSVRDLQNAAPGGARPTWQTPGGYYLGPTGNAAIHVSPARLRVAMVNGSAPGRLLTCDLQPE